MKLVLSLATLLLTAVAAADEKDPNFTALTPEAAGSDFRFQGEYSGKIRTENGEQSIGVQVVAEGSGRFAWTAMMGGLPGAGWDVNTPIRGSGERQGDTAIMKGDTGRGEIRDGSLVVYTGDNVKIGELSRTQRVSPTMGKKPPATALVLFDGSTADHFEGGKLSPDKLLMQGAASREKHGSGELHIEFLLPFMPNARGQGRGNSGVYLQGRYEVQVLDSFGLSGEQNECGGIYSIAKPSANLCFPPLSWQTYDVDYHAATFDADGKKTKDAWMTVRHNGVVIHDKVKLTHATTAAPVAEGPQPGPLYLQDHGNQVRYRNIWFNPAAE